MELEEVCWESSAWRAPSTEANAAAGEERQRERESGIWLP